MKLKHGGLNLIDLVAATKSLLVKWVIKAFEVGKSNLHLLIQIRSGNSRPNMKTKELGVGWMFLQHHMLTFGKDLGKHGKTCLHK